MSTAEAFTYPGGRVDPGEHSDFRYTVTETYLGDPVRMPVTVINGPHSGPTVSLSRRPPTATNSTASRWSGPSPTSGTTPTCTAVWSVCQS